MHHSLQDLNNSLTVYAHQLMDNLHWSVGCHWLVTR